MVIRAFIGDLRKGRYLDIIHDGLVYIGFNQAVSRESSIFIKPNLTFPIYRPGVMTSLEAIEATIISIKDYTPHIYIGDSDSGGYNRFSMGDVFQKIGLFDLTKKYNVEVVNLSKLEQKMIHFRYKNRNFNLNLPRLLIEEIDLLVTMPVPKIHANTGVSLTFKNQWGCIPENYDRLRYHPYLEHVLLEVNQAVKAKVAIIDGKYGLNVNGPMQGQNVDLGWALITNNIGAGARLACELMQINLEKIKHLRYAQSLGMIPDMSEIQINQNLQPFIREKFYLKRKWTDWPGYFAFHNSYLASLAYFSPASGFLHRLLYLFREPFYEYQRYTKKDNP
jgi:uncharacterized protein (DUF362 family)